PRQMTVELLFDVTLSTPAKASVRPITDALFAMMEVPNGGSGAGSAPPTVTFRWGAYESFKAVPASLDVRFVLFRADGEPVRAWAQMTLLQVAADPQGTLKVIDDARFALAAPLTVKLAKPIGGQLGDVFDGEITTIEAELGSSLGGYPVLELTVTAHDRSHRMHAKTTTRTFRQTTVTDIARKMAG